MHRERVKAQLRQLNWGKSDIAQNASDTAQIVEVLGSLTKADLDILAAEYERKAEVVEAALRIGNHLRPKPKSGERVREVIERAAQTGDKEAIKLIANGALDLLAD